MGLQEIYQSICDAYILKYDKNQSQDWTQIISSPTADNGQYIELDDTGNIYVFGITNSPHENKPFQGLSNNGSYDIFISKYNSSGLNLWNRLLGADGFKEDYIQATTIDSEGSIYVAGKTNGNIDNNLNKGDYDVLVAKYNSSGDKLWTTTIGSSSYDCAYGITLGENNSIFISGSTRGDIGGNENLGDHDIFVAKLNSDNGNESWIKTFGTSDTDYSTAINIDASNNLYVGGYTKGNLNSQSNAGGFDAYILKLNSNGTEQWTKLLGSSELFFSSELTTGLDDSIYITGVSDLD